MFDSKNPYTLRTDAVEGSMRFFVCFRDGQAVLNEVEVSRAVFAEFQDSIKTERRLCRWDERHIEQSELSDITLGKRAVAPQKNSEDILLGILSDEQVRYFIEQLPPLQKRRFMLHHECGLTYQQIAEVEGCSFQAVAKSVKAAEKNLQKNFLSQG